MAAEVLPYVPDAWVDHAKTKIGYEIPLTRHFYRYVPPRPLEEIDAEIKALEEEIQELLGEVTAVSAPSRRVRLKHLVQQNDQRRVGRPTRVELRRCDRAGVRRTSRLDGVGRFQSPDERSISPHDRRAKTLIEGDLGRRDF